MGTDDTARRLNRTRTIVSAGWRWTSFGAASAILAFLSLVPPEFFGRLPEPVTSSDKIGHFAAYGVYALICAWTPAARGAISAASGTLIVAYCTGYGIVMEWMQRWLQPAERTFSAADMLANALGATVSVLLILACARLRTSARRREAPAA